MTAIKIIDAQSAAQMIPAGARVMYGGFLGCGCAEQIIEAQIALNRQNLHMIVICTDFPDKGVGKLVKNRQIGSLQVSHIGTNPCTQEQFNAGTLKIEFNPQGTLSERIRIAGAGIGGFLTKAGVGTVLEQETHHQILELDGERYFLERPIHAEFALIRAAKADRAGNLIYSKTGRNSNPMMAMAAKITIVEVDEIVEVGELRSEEIITPGIFVNYLVPRTKVK